MFHKEHKHVFRKMNLDKDPMTLTQDEYTYMKNGVPVQGTDGHDWAVGNVLGNTHYANADLPAGTNTVIFECEDLSNTRVFYGVHNSNNNHTIYMLDSTYAFTRVMRTSLLGFVLGRFYDVDIVDNLLIWVDGSTDTQIKKIDVSLAIAGGTYTPTAEEILLIKRPPQLALTGSTLNDPAQVTNLVKDNYFQFYYQYIYENNEQSVFSALSDLIRVTAGVLATSDHNAIDVTINASEVIPATVKQINFGVRLNGGNQFIVYKSVFPVLGVLSSRTHRFYNDTFLYTLPDNLSLKWFDSVPLAARSCRIVLNRLFTINNTEGYEVTGSPVTGFTVALASGSGLGRTHKHRGSYSFGLMFFDHARRHAGVRIGASTTLTIPDRNEVSADLDRYSVNWNLAALAQADIPLWATHYAIVRTRVKNFSYFLSHKTGDMIGTHKREVPDPTTGSLYIYSDADIDWQYWAIDISPLLQLNIGYTFQKGDRIRLWGNDGAATITADAEIDFQDGRFVFTKFFPWAPVGGGAGAEGDQWVYEIYRPKTDEVELFFETGLTYAITNPGTGSRALATTAGSVFGECEVGERAIYVRKEATPPPTYAKDDPYNGVGLESGGPTEAFEMMNQHETKFNLWPGYNMGRSQLFSAVGSFQKSATNTVRHSSAQYNKGGRVNGMNEFEAIDEYPLPVENGPGIKLMESDNVITAICQNETSALYIGQAFVNTADGSQFLAKTDRVIGDDRKYFGGFGSIHPESVVEEGGRVYFFDMTKGAILRRSNDGLTQICKYGVSSFIKKYSRDNWANRATFRFVGGFDPIHELYVLTAINQAGAVQWTLGFHEPTNAWAGFYDYSPQLYSKLNGYLISFNDGKVYVHNNSTTFNQFYGVDYDREIEFAVAVRDFKVVAWHGLAIFADTRFVSNTGTNDIVIYITNDGASLLTGNGGNGTQSTTIRYLELIEREGAWRSAIFRDLNTPQPFTPAEMAKFKGNPMRGQVIRIRIRANVRTVASKIRGASILYRASELS